LKPNNLGNTTLVSVALSGLAVLVLAVGLRYGLLENGLLPRDCDAAGAPALACGFKWALVQSFLHQRLGIAGLVLGLAAFALSCRRLAWAGWLLGLAGLVLYNQDYAAVGGLLSMLVLARPAQQHR